MDLRRLLPLLRPYRAVAAVAVLVLLVAAAATLALPGAVGLVIDEGFLAEGGGSVDRYFIALFGIAVVLAVFGSARYYLVTWLGERVVADLRSRIYSHVLGLGPAFFESRRSGEVLSRITTDTTLVQSMAGVNLSICLRSSLTLLGGLVMLTFTSARLTGIIVVLIPLVIAPLLFFGRRVRRLSRTSQDRVADTSAMAAETLNAIETVQAFGLEGLQTRRFDAAVAQSFVAAVLRVRARALLTGCAILIVFGAVVFVLWLGARDVMSGAMTPGQLGQFLLYAVLVAGSAASLSEMWGELQRAAGALERIAELLDEVADIQPPATPRALPRPVRGALRFDAVDFSYPTRPESRALHAFDLEVRPGELLALVGPSGAGKSTVLRLLQRFHDPQRGRVLFEDIDLRELDPAELRAQLAVVPQDCVLFAESALENIRYGRPGADDAAVRAAARAAGADGFIEALPQGYATQLGERGTRLSGGQRQRIAIARAVLRDPRVLLLDEATSALDARSEQIVRDALDALMRERTTIVVAHRLSTVQHADRIVVMEHGRVVETGNHETLMADAGLYAHLARIQLSAS